MKYHYCPYCRRKIVVKVRGKMITSGLIDLPKITSIKLCRYTAELLKKFNKGKE